MPSLTRLVIFLATGSSVVLAGMLALANLVAPSQHEIVAVVPLHHVAEPAAVTTNGARRRASPLETASHRELSIMLENMPFPRG
jgi:hypothetical protein